MLDHAAIDQSPVYTPCRALDRHAHLALASDLNAFPEPVFQIAITEATQFSALNNPFPPGGRTHGHGGSDQGR